MIIALKLNISPATKYIITIATMASKKIGPVPVKDINGIIVAQSLSAPPCARVSAMAVPAKLSLKILSAIAQLLLNRVQPKLPIVAPIG